MSLWWLICLLTALASANPPAQSVDRVAWLQGCWRLDSPGRTIEENWMAPRGGNLLGVARTTRGDSLAEYELVFIRERGGQLVYEAHPSGQPAATFPCIEVSDSTVVFENPGHDFPQRVGYRFQAPDSLHAWIEGARGTSVRRIAFPYRRVACPGR